MKDNFKVYLSGPITGLSYSDAIGWTEYAKDVLWIKYGISGYRPLRGKFELKDETCLDAMGSTKSIVSLPKGIYRRDKYDVQSCDAMLVNLIGAKRISIGTMFEMAWADLLQKPMVLVMEPKNNLHEHIFVNESVTYRVSNLDVGIDLINLILNDDLA